MPLISRGGHCWAVEEVSKHSKHQCLALPLILFTAIYQILWSYKARYWMEEAKPGRRVKHRYTILFYWDVLKILNYTKKNHGANGRKPTCQCRRCGFNPWVRKMPWRRAWQPTPILLPGKFHGWRSLVGIVHEVSKNGTWLSDFTLTFQTHGSVFLKKHL